MYKWEGFWNVYHQHYWWHNCYHHHHHQSHHVSRFISFWFLYEIYNNESENSSNTKMYPDPVLIYVNGLLLLKCTLMCQIYKMLYNYPMSIWKALHAHWRTTSSPKHAKHIIWRIIQVRMSFIPHMIFSVTQMIMLLLCLLLFVWRGFHFEYLLLALWWICRYWFKWIQFTCALGRIR